jgi:hypothetical protein
VPQSALLGILTANDMKVALTNCSGWEKSAEKENPASKLINIPTENKVLLVNKGDAKETTFYIGSAGISRNNNPDYVAIEVVNTLLWRAFYSQ